MTAEKNVVFVAEGLKQVGLSMENIFAATKDEGADIAAAFRGTPCVDVPCSAHVQQTCVKDIYIKNLEEPKLKKNGEVKQHSGSLWPDGTMLSDTEKADLREIRSKLVDRSDDLHDKLM